MEKQENFDRLKEKYCPEGSVLRRHQHRMLEMLGEFDKICKKHHIKYWVAGGTMLGTIRHGGFIPWDDDLDVELMRDDYLKLMDILEAELPPHLAIQNSRTDKNYFFFYAKLRDRRSVLNEVDGYDRYFKERGVYIDIFPIERIPSWAHKLSLHTIGHVYKILKRTDLPDNVIMRRVRLFHFLNDKVIYPVLRFVARIWSPKYYDDCLGIPFFLWRYPSDIFPLRTMKFEGMDVPVVRNYDQQLRLRYGDYMQLPNEEEIQGHVSSIELWD